MLCTLHQLDLAQEYADRIIGMKAGRIEIDAAIADTDTLQLNTLYSGMTRVDAQAGSGMSESTRIPRVFNTPSALTWVLVVGFAAFSSRGDRGWKSRLTELVRGASNLVRASSVRPCPDFPRARHRRLHAETLNIAVVGVIRLLLLYPSWRFWPRKTPHPCGGSGSLARFVISVSRTIPDLIWALIFVVTVGLEILAGVLAIIMDTIGFAARFLFRTVRRGSEEIDPKR